MGRGSKLLLFFVTVVLMLCLMQFPVKAGHGGGQKVILIVADRLTFEDMAYVPGFLRLIEGGAVALMNNRPSGSYSACKGYISIGSGDRAEGSASATTAMDINDQTKEIFFRRTGCMTKPGMVVNPDINRLKDQNLKGEYRAMAGSIGHYLHENGLKTAVLGNCDCGDTQIRWAISIAMDRDGIVDYGTVEKQILKEDLKFPTGLRTDYEMLVTLTEEMTEKADFVVIETGDLTRVEENKSLLNAVTYSNHRQGALSRIGGFVEWAIGMADLKGWLLILVTPYPSEECISGGARLTPVVIYGDRFFQGLLTSGTTKREGIIGGIDIAPTILNHFGITAKELTGRPLMSVGDADNLNKVNGLNARTVITSNLRYPLLYYYVIFAIAVVILGLIVILCPRVLRGLLIGPEEVALIFVMVFPAVLLILPALKLKTLMGTAFSAVAISVCISIVAHHFIRKSDCLLLSIAGVTTVLIVLDIVNSSKMLKNSVLGYDPIIGARYYGIGNEYMGIVAGSTVIALCSLIERYKPPLRAVVPIFGAVVIAVGCPAFGANLGGAITCFVTFSFFLLHLFGIKAGIKQLLAVGLTLAAVLVVFLLVDILLIDDCTHLAAAAQGALKTGPSSLIPILQRKAAMNAKLFRFNIWTKMLITVITVTGVLFYRPVGIFKRIFIKYPVYTMGWSSLTVAATVGMAVNDSGIVASATCSIFFITSILYIVIQERKDKEKCC